MSKKNKIIIIVCFAIVCMLLIMGMIISSKTKEETYDDTYNTIMEKLDNKESFLVYITDDDEYKCNNCNFINKIINFYHDEYNLDFIYYNKTKNKAGDLDRLNKKFQFQDNYLTAPAVMLFKDGMISAVANEMSGEAVLKDFLKEYDFITEEYASIEKELKDKDEFNKIISSNNNELIFISNGDIKLKKILFESAVKNKFNYYTIYEGKMDYYDQYMTLSKMFPKLNGSSLIIVNNKKIVDYIDKADEKKVNKFLQKNNIAS